MVYTYLLNLYEEIEVRLQKIDLISLKESEMTPYEQGRKDILNEFKVYLADNMNNKLPKRIRKRLADQK